MPFQIIPSGTHIDFIGKRRIALSISALVLLAAATAVAVRGVNLGIDFAGGTEVQLRFDPAAGVEEGALRAVAEACGITSPNVVRYGDASEAEFLVSFRDIVEDGGVGAETTCPLTDADRERLAKVDAGTGNVRNAGNAAAIDRFVAGLDNSVARGEIQRIEFVGPRVGGELRRDGMNSMLIAMALILAYITFRFSSRFAPGAVVALVHDVGITAGIFVILGLEFDLRVLAALLAIIGYSLNDTIIIYDRIRENMELHTKFDLVDVLNRSVNQTLARTLLTSFSTLLAVSALLIFGGQVIRPFALAMFIGVMVGTYSSVFVASPMLLYLENYLGDGGKAKSDSDKDGRKAARAGA